MSLLEVLRKMDRFLGKEWSLFQSDFKNKNGLNVVYIQSMTQYYADIKEYFRETNKGAKITDSYKGYFGQDYAYRVLTIDNKDMYLTFQRNEKMLSQDHTTMLRILYTFNISDFYDMDGNFQTTKSLIEANPFEVDGRKIGNTEDWQ